MRSTQLAADWGRIATMAKPFLLRWRPSPTPEGPISRLADQFGG